ncbi:MAG: radical SAM protein [Candidatus Margulisiibacteriota bacterium]|jgi:putative pyruvate formate lyase activating enzyme
MKKQVINKNLDLLARLTQKCKLCPRACLVKRDNNEAGFCQRGIFAQDLKTNGLIPVVYSELHHGEEPPISGTNGSGAIFFAFCNLSCKFCQNYQISQDVEIEKIKWLTSEALSKKMLELQSMGAHNINLISPTHVINHVAKSIFIAKNQGLKIPVIYNSNGYDSVQTLKYLNGLIDIYLPDFKYGADLLALKYSGAKNYFDTAKNAISKMYRQVGNLKLDDAKIAQKGILVRHLVLPNNQASSRQVLTFLSTISKSIFISLMAQYTPLHLAKSEKLIDRALLKKEYQNIVDFAFKIGLKNCFIQEFSSRHVLIPDFEKSSPFINIS